MEHKFGLGGVYLSTYKSSKKLARFLDFTIAQGVLDVDVAPLYGSGASERILGRVEQRHDFNVTTKVGVAYQGMKHPLTGELFDRGVHSSVPEQIWAQWFPPESLEGYLRESLDRLQLSKVNRFLLHSVNPYTELKPYAAELARLKSIGLVDRIGLSIDHEPTIDFGWCDSLQVTFEHALRMEIKHEDLTINGILRDVGGRLDETVRLVDNLPQASTLLIGTGKTQHLAEVLKRLRK